MHAEIHALSCMVCAMHAGDCVLSCVVCATPAGVHVLSCVVCAMHAGAHASAWLFSAGCTEWFTKSQVLHEFAGQVRCDREYQREASCMREVLVASSLRSTLRWKATGVQCCLGYSLAQCVGRGVSASSVAAVAHADPSAKISGFRIMP